MLDKLLAEIEGGEYFSLCSKLTKLGEELESLAIAASDHGFEGLWEKEGEKIQKQIENAVIDLANLTNTAGIMIDLNICKEMEEPAEIWTQYEREELEKAYNSRPF
ncbi:MAG TPA: hypothetical protein VK211_29255 [Kamptonema sp.]|nr:hypothetical protein [Kamptonema sp.]